MAGHLAREAQDWERAEEIWEKLLPLESSGLRRSKLLYNLALSAYQNSEYELGRQRLALCIAEHPLDAASILEESLSAR